MAAITDFLYMIDDFMWGTWMTILLVGVGIIFSIRFSFRYQWKIAFNFKNTWRLVNANALLENGNKHLAKLVIFHKLSFSWRIN